MITPLTDWEDSVDCAHKKVNVTHTELYRAGLKLVLEKCHMNKKWQYRYSTVEVRNENF